MDIARSSIAVATAVALVLVGCATTAPGIDSRIDLSNPSSPVIPEWFERNPGAKEYFNRIKSAVAAKWDPYSVTRTQDPTGEKYLYKDRVTVLAITLDANGALSDAHVFRSSGVNFLDRAAIQAFEKAQPFVNPPHGLADSSGAIKFTFGFYLQRGSHPLIH